MKIKIKTCDDCPFQYKIKFGDNGVYDWGCSLLEWPSNSMGKKAKVPPLEICPLRSEPITLSIENEG